MTAYFDIENLESFLAQPKNEFFDDCRKLLRKQLDLSFNFRKEDFKKSEALMHFLKDLSEGIGDKKINYYENKFPLRSIKSNSHKDFSNEELLSAYFINDETIDKLKNKEELLIADVGEEMNLFRMLFLNNTDYKFERKLRIGDQFTAWEDFNNFYCPYIDSIIVDNFILSDKSLFETNLKGIVRNTLKDGIRKKINIIIFLKADQENVPFNELKSEIRKIVEEKYTDAPNVTIIKHYTEHDRTILKNFVRVYSGDTFNYFLSDGSKTTKGKEIHFSSIADKENYNLYLRMLSDLQKIVDNSLSQNIVGDKESRFLNFP